ncbi:MAG: helix-turn-helix transcriptional regulator, partial [Paenibacillaceae bacterium]|nr:helix-turn-helix transcriptional regulator [Paenibacillaceae bacterium]
IDNLYAEAKATSEQIYIDKDIAKLRNGNALDPAEVPRIFDRLVSYSIASTDLLSVYIYSGASDCYYSNYGALRSCNGEFFDQGIMDILGHMEKPDATLIPRIIETAGPNETTKRPVKAYSLILSEMNRNPVRLDSAVILNFKENWISDVFKELHLDQTSDYLFLNPEGIVVGGTEPESFLREWDHDELRQHLLRAHGASFQIKRGDRQYLVTDIFSERMNWSIVKLTSFDIVNGKLNLIRNNTLIVSFAVLLAAMFVVLIWSRNIQLPVNRVVLKLQELKQEQEGSYQSLRNAFLKRLLEAYDGSSSVADGLEKYRIAVDLGAPLALVIVKIDRYKQFADSCDSKDRIAVYQRLKEIVYQELAACATCEVVEYDNDCLVAVLNVGMPQSPTWKPLISRLQANAANRLGISVTCAISDTIDDGEEMPAELERTIELLHYRLIYGHGSILLASELRETPEENKFHYAARKEKMLFEQLLSGKPEQSLSIFADMVEEAKQDSYNSLMIMLHRLILATHFAVDKLANESKLAVSFDFYTFSQTVNTLETLDEITALFHDTFTRIAGSLVVSSNDRVARLVAKVNECIEQNYTDPNLSIGLIAEQLGKLPQYVNRMYKGATGRSIQSGIDEYRFAKSLVLLTETKKSIKTIATEVGIENEKYYYVLFKKRMGITPSEYRHSLK